MLKDLNIPKISYWNKPRKLASIPKLSNNCGRGLKIDSLHYQFNLTPAGVSVAYYQPSIYDGQNVLYLPVLGNKLSLIGLRTRVSLDSQNIVGYLFNSLSLSYSLSLKQLGINNKIQNCVLYRLLKLFPHHGGLVKTVETLLGIIDGIGYRDGFSEDDIQSIFDVMDESVRSLLTAFNYKGEVVNEKFVNNHKAIALIENWYLDWMEGLEEVRNAA